MAETYPIFVQTIALNVSDHPHPYHVDNSGLALKAWQDEIAKKPSLFNGDVMLESNLNYTKGGLQGTRPCGRIDSPLIKGLPISLS